MTPPSQSLTFTQGDTKQLTLTHETTFGDYSAKLLIGKRCGDELLGLVKELPLTVDGDEAKGTLLVDMAPGVYETQLLLTDSISDEDETAFGPTLIIKARIGGWPESPSP